MKLTEIINDKWVICEIAETGKTIADFYKTNKGDVESIYAVMQHVAGRVNGPIKYNANIIHEIDKKGNLFEFIKGNLRVPFFLDSNRVIICTHGFYKNSKKTPTKQKNIIKKYRNKYFEAKRLKNITVFDIEENEVKDHVIQKDV
jgi:hypothetical protein